MKNKRFFYQRETWILLINRYKYLILQHQLTMRLFCFCHFVSWDFHAHPLMRFSLQEAAEKWS